MDGTEQPQTTFTFIEHNSITPSVVITEKRWHRVDDQSKCYCIQAKNNIKLYCHERPTWNEEELATKRDVTGQKLEAMRHYYMQQKEIQDLKEKLDQIGTWLMMQSPPTFTQDLSQCRQIVEEHKKQFPTQ